MNRDPLSGQNTEAPRLFEAMESVREDSGGYTYLFTHCSLALMSLSLCIMKPSLPARGRSDGGMYVLIGTEPERPCVISGLEADVFGGAEPSLERDSPFRGS